MLCADCFNQRQQPALVFESVDLVDHQNRRHLVFFQHAQRHGVLLGPASGLNQKQHHINIFQTGADSAVHHAVEYAFVGFVNTGRVDIDNLRVGSIPDAENTVARGLRAIDGNCHLETHQLVDQGGFADIGPADDGRVAAAKFRHRIPAVRPEPLKPLPVRQHGGCYPIHKTHAPARRYGNSPRNADDAVCH